MPSNSKIDLSRYQTDKLATEVVAVLSIPESIRTVITTVFCAIAILLVLNAATSSLVRGEWIPWIVTSLYTLGIALVIGLLFGILRVASSLLARTGNILRLILETAREIAKDYQGVRAGDKSGPSAVEIVELVYDQIVLPTMEAAVAKSIGFLGRPLLWVYRRTIGGGVRYVIKRMKTSSLSGEEIVEIEQKAKVAMCKVANESSQIELALNKAMNYSNQATQMLRNRLLYPVEVCFVIFACLAIWPLVLFWSWMS